MKITCDPLKNVTNSAGGQRSAAMPGYVGTHLDFASRQKIEPMEEVQNAHVSSNERTWEGRPLERINRRLKSTESLILRSSIAWLHV